MLLKRLNESITTGFIATTQTALPVKRTHKKDKLKPINDEYMGISKSNHPKFGKTVVMQPNEPKKSKSSDNKWMNQYAEKNNPDERLLPQFRGHGY